MNGIIFNTKSEGVNILEEYFSKFNSNDLGYYLEKPANLLILEFIDLNVFCPEDIELSNLFLNHIKIVMKKIFNLSSELNNNRGPIKISFISNSILWSNLFVIGNTIFVKYPYLIEIFECIEYNEYTTMDNVYIEGEEIFDMCLLKNISYCIYSILQNLNPNAWNEFIFDTYGCLMVPIENIKFKFNYKIIQEPNVNLSQGKVPVYYVNSDNIYASFNSIYSTTNDNLFSPYWKEQIIKLEYKDGLYIEIEQIEQIEQIDINKYKTKLFINNLIPTPFENNSIKITNMILHN